LAAPRHRSLAASLEWSYGLLSERERTVLRRLAVFSGSFTLDSARAFATGPGVSAPDVDECIMNLIAKSLMTADVRGTAAIYRLSETTQIFAREKLADSEAVHPRDSGSVEPEIAASIAEEAQLERRGSVVTRLMFGGPAKGQKLSGPFVLHPIEPSLAAS
jgi:predicted ATPase